MPTNQNGIPTGVLLFTTGRSFFLSYARVYFLLNQAIYYALKDQIQFLPGVLGTVKIRHTKSCGEIRYIQVIGL